MSKSSEIRRKFLLQPSALNRHSLNQASIQRSIEGEDDMEDVNKKRLRSARRQLFALGEFRLYQQVKRRRVPLRDVMDSLSYGLELPFVQEEGES